jgi:heme/copper-type cytochrome/quinol oxidase subunit 2
MKSKLITVAICFFSMVATAENLSAATEIKITGAVNGQCSPDMVDLNLGESYEITLEAEQGMFLFEAPDFSLSLMAAPNMPAKQVIVPSQKGNFTFKCGIHGAPDDQKTIGMIMVM